MWNYIEHVGDQRPDRADGSGDADLYVQFGTPPTLDSYDCRPYIDGNEETCIVPATAGTWYVLVHGFNAFDDVSLVGGYSEN